MRLGKRVQSVDGLAAGFGLGTETINAFSVPCFID
jgi:hypothetical protein